MNSLMGKGRISSFLRQHLYPNSEVLMQHILFKKDNKATKSWINKAAISSVQAQQLIRIMAKIGKTTNVYQKSEHIPGNENLNADVLCHPDENHGYRLDHTAIIAYLNHVLMKYTRLRNYKIFIPSSKLFAALTWALQPTDQLDTNQLTPPPLEQHTTFS